MKLTFPQQDIYFEQMLFPNEPIHNIGAKIEIKGSVNFPALQNAYKKLIEQHDAFRSIVVANNRDVEIKILENPDTNLGFKDFSDHKQAQLMAIEYMQKEFVKPFELFNGDLLHVFTLIKVDADFYYLFSVYHHIITDGWSTSLMFQRLVQNYNEILEFEKVISQYSYTYTDFAQDDYQYQNSECFIEDKKYWVQRFNPLPENLFETIQDSDSPQKGGRKEITISRSRYNQLDKLASKHNCSTFHIILGVLYTYFGRKYQNDDFAIGLPVLNRGTSKHKKTVGLFMGVSPLRIKLDFEETFGYLVRNIKSQLRKDYRHQRLPLGKLIQELQIFHEKDKLFNITLSYEKQNYSVNFKNTLTKVIPLSHESERVALAIYIREFDEHEDVKIDFDYNMNYLNDKDAEKIVRHFDNLIDVILSEPDKKLRELNYLTEEENHLLDSFNQTEAHYPKDITLIDLFISQVSKFADKAAVNDGTNCYTYLELDQLSDQIAASILSLYGDKDKSPIAVLIGRSVNMIALLLGIFKAGRSYIPLDPTFPKERLNYIIENSQTKLLITEEQIAFQELEGVKVLNIDAVLFSTHSFKKSRIIQNLSKETAYIIYTSGSTGNPKGVEISHSALLNFLTSIQQNPGIDSSDILFSVTTYSFDISILEFFLPLTSGATLYIADHHCLADPHLIIQRLKEIAPTFIQATPSFYQMLFNIGWQGNKQLKVLCGGDLLSKSLAEKLINHSSELWNMYGPTETTIWSSAKKMQHFTDANNIGKPINNTKLYVLDQYLNRMPIGTLGAIYISGDGLAKGYFNNSRLTEEKFIKSPFAHNSLIYETGDVGKWNANGEIVFFGRNDNQVKIRGYRIELGDIEAQLNKINGIKDSIVIARKGELQESYLVAFVILSNIINVDQINTILNSVLPHYMIPHQIVTLDKFPLTPNQKIDRKSLSQIKIHDYTNDVDKFPSTKFEIELAKIWKEIFNIRENINIKSNFFSLGGDSLSATRLLRMISDLFLVDIPLRAIFDFPTIEKLANYLEDANLDIHKGLVVSEVKDKYLLSPSQINIWLASQQKEYSIAYNMSAAYTINGVLNVDNVISSINELISAYEILRTNFIEVAGLPYQRINAFENKKNIVSIYDLEDKKIDDFIFELSNTEFDLENDLLIRLQLIKDDKQMVLLFSTHHIVMDGLSLEIFIKAFIEIYNRSVVLEPENSPKFQFKDYSEWFNKKVAKHKKANVAFWKNYLRSYVVKDSFKIDYVLSKNQNNAKKYHFELPCDITLILKQYALEQHVTFYHVLVTVMKLLIMKVSEHNDICIGSLNYGRSMAELNNQIGMFVNTIVLRTKIESDNSFLEILKNVKKDLIELENYQVVPFEMFSKSIIDIVVVYQNREFIYESIEDLQGVRLNYKEVNSKFAKMPLIFNFYESGHNVKGVIDYNCDLYAEDTIESMVVKFIMLLDLVSKNQSLKIGSINLKPEFEKNVVLDFDFNF